MTFFWWKMSAKWLVTFKHFKFPLLPLLTHSALVTCPGTSNLASLTPLLSSQEMYLLTSRFDLHKKNSCWVRKIQAYTMYTIHINTAEKEFRQSQPNLWKFMTEQPFSLINWQAWALVSIVEIFLFQYSIDLENISLRIFDWSWWKFPFHSRIEFHSSVLHHNRWISGERKN